MARVLIHGKEYTTVAERVNDLHSIHKDTLSITTELVSLQDGLCIMKATIITPKGTYTGFAMEREGSSMINKTSFLENCETSCIGRAASAAGLGGGEYASANEVLLAVEQQKSNIPDGAPVTVPTISGTPKSQDVAGAPQDAQGAQVG